MWSKKAELIKRAVSLAKEKYPKGFNKAQLIECSKEVFGGFAANPLKGIKTLEDVHNKGNYFSYIDGHYPRGMSPCYVVGLSGECGAEGCPVFKSGDCDVDDPEPFVDEIKSLIDNEDFNEGDLLQLLSNYPNIEEFEILAEYYYKETN